MHNWSNLKWREIVDKKLFLVYRTNDSLYGCYQFIIVAENEDEAVSYCPHQAYPGEPFKIAEKRIEGNKNEKFLKEYHAREPGVFHSWTDKKYICAKQVGMADTSLEIGTIIITDSSS